MSHFSGSITQEFGGYDFELVMAISNSKVNIQLVGDFHQHTFDTSRDGSKNRSLHKDYEKYKMRFKKAGLVVDTTSLSKSYRCRPTVCDFVRKHLGVEIYSHSNEATEATFLDRQVDADRLHACKGCEWRLKTPSLGRLKRLAPDVLFVIAIGLSVPQDPSQVLRGRSSLNSL